MHAWGLPILWICRWSALWRRWGRGNVGALRRSITRSALRRRSAGPPVPSGPAVPAALPMGGKKPFRLAAQGDWIRARLAASPDITGRELLAELRERKVEVSYHGVWQPSIAPASAIKNTCTPVSKIAMIVARRREQWQRAAGQSRCWASDLYRRDLGQDEHDLRLHGRCPLGQRLVAKVAHGHWKTLTSWLACDATGSSRPASSTSRSMPSASWPGSSSSWCRRCGAATSSSWTISPAKGAAAVRRPIRAAGALLIFLLPYSPDLNLIEQAFFKLKTLLAQGARTREQIETCIRDLLAKITTKRMRQLFHRRWILNLKLSCSSRRQLNGVRTNADTAVLSLAGCLSDLPACHAARARAHICAGPAALNRALA